MATVTIGAELAILGRAARAASRELARLPSAVKDRGLECVARALEERQAPVCEANEKDLAAGRARGLSDSFLDRLLLTPARLSAMAADVRAIAALPDPVGEEFDVRTMANGLIVGKRRVPLGVVGAIYESRPNVTIDIAALCLKSGNACILRGGSEALHSNSALAGLLRTALGEAGVPEGAVQFVENPDRALVQEMLQMRESIDLLIPRGGAELVRFVAEHATMPAVTGGVGVCHTYVDRSVDREMALDVVTNAKVQRPSTCNALDTLLVHRETAPHLLPDLARRLGEAGVELRCDARALSLLGPLEGVRVTPATPNDWGTEFLDLILSVRVVDSLEEALDHIEGYGSGHSEAIVTRDYAVAMRFLNEVDAAAVFVNASTRFTDGARFGLGAEVAISTNKFHARGPMGLRELTSYKWVIHGNGHIVE